MQETLLLVTLLVQTQHLRLQAAELGTVHLLLLIGGILFQLEADDRSMQLTDHSFLVGLSLQTRKLDFTIIYRMTA